MLFSRNTVTVLLPLWLRGDNSIFELVTKGVRSRLLSEAHVRGMQSGQNRRVIVADLCVPWLPCVGATCLHRVCEVFLMHGRVHEVV